MLRIFGQSGLVVLVGIIFADVVSADEPGPIRRIFYRNECETCEVDPGAGHWDQTTGNGQYGSPATVRYPVNVPGHEVITPTPNRIRLRWNRRGYGCWAHRDSVGSPSLRSTLLFMFGSSRAFFGEPCIPEKSLVERAHHR